MKVTDLVSKDTHGKTMSGILSGHPFTWHSAPVGTFANFNCSDLHVWENMLGFFEYLSRQETPLTYPGCMVQHGLQKLPIGLLNMIMLICWWRILFPINLLSLGCWEFETFMALLDQRWLGLWLGYLTYVADALETSGNPVGKTPSIQLGVLGDIDSS